MVGNGKSIDIWADKWLNRAEACCPKPPTVRPTPRKVSSLIKEDRTWDVDNVRHMFETEDASAILNISLSWNVMDDKLIDLASFFKWATYNQESLCCSEE